jgi:hypothetical protein
VKLLLQKLPFSRMLKVFKKIRKPHRRGKIAGNARKELEAKSGRRVVSSSNFLSHQLDLEASTIKSVESKDNES